MPSTGGLFYFDKNEFDRDMKDLLNDVERVSTATGLHMNELIQVAGGFAARSAASNTTENLKPRGFKGGTPKKLFTRKVVAQSAKVQQQLGGVWYAKVGQAESKKGKKRKKKTAVSPKLSQPVSGRKKKRKDSKAPFFSREVIRKPKAKGLKKLKVVLYLRGPRRRWKFGYLPTLDDKAVKGKALYRIRNTGSGKLGWLKSLNKLPKASAKDKRGYVSEMGMANHITNRSKSRVSILKGSNKTPAELKIWNLVGYTGLQHVGAQSAQKAMRNTKKWFRGYWVNEQKKAVRHYKRKYKKIS